MEFGSVIWAGAAKTHLIRLERIQHKFLMWLAVNSCRPCASLEYDRLLTHFGVLRIDQRLVQTDLNYLHNVFSGRVDSADILAMFRLSVPSRRTRLQQLLYVPTARVETIKNGMFGRLPRLVNMLCVAYPSTDLFGRKSAYKKQVASFVRSVNLY